MPYRAPALRYNIDPSLFQGANERTKDPFLDFSHPYRIASFSHSASSNYRNPQHTSDTNTAQRFSIVLNFGLQVGQSKNQYSCPTKTVWYSYPRAQTRYLAEIVVFVVYVVPKGNQR